MKKKKKDFVNFFYGRNYETVKSKYLEMFCKNFFDETLKNMKNGLQYCIEFSNKFYECTRGMIIMNKILELCLKNGAELAEPRRVYQKGFFKWKD